MEMKQNSEVQMITLIEQHQLHNKFNKTCSQFEIQGEI